MNLKIKSLLAREFLAEFAGTFILIVSLIRIRIKSGIEWVDFRFLEMRASLNLS